MATDQDRNNPAKILTNQNNLAAFWLFFIALPLILIGFAIVGEYLFRIIQNVEKQPLYLIREIIKKD